MARGASAPSAATSWLTSASALANISSEPRNTRSNNAILCSFLSKFHLFLRVDHGLDGADFLHGLGAEIVGREALAVGFADIGVVVGLAVSVVGWCLYSG